MTFDKSEVELSVGETLMLGDRRVTVVEIDGDEVVFRLDDSRIPELPKATVRPR